MSQKRVVYNLFNKSKGLFLASEALVADDFFLRLKGLMFRKTIAAEAALIFYRTSSIHTFFMRFPLDIVFLNKKMQVVRFYEALKPGRVVFCLFAYLVIELPPHKTSRKNLEIGDILELAPINPSFSGK
ncbi:MAG: DUF192 domain-containing protein [Candidatus Omnitrophica bacterium]|nr:DUF192 domain-containing protein [Candidatus Omnitrophota bacterium]